MMYKKSLAKIGISKGVLVGILFMLLVIGAIAVSVKMVRGVNTVREVVADGSEGLGGPDNKISLSEAQSQTNLKGSGGVQVGDSVEGTTLKKVDGTTINNPNNIPTEITRSEGGYEINSGGNNPQHVDFGGDVTVGEKSVTGNTPDTKVVTPEGPGPGAPRTTVEGQATSACPGGGSEGGSSGGGDGGGSKTPKLDAALQYGQQVAGYVSSAVGPLKDIVKKQPNAPNVFYPNDPSREVATTVENGATTNIEDENKIVTLAQNDVKLPGNIKGVTLKDFNTENSIIVIYGSVDAMLITPANKVTHVINNLAKGEPALTNTGPSSTTPKSEIINFFLPLIRLIGFVDAASADITGNVIIGSPSQEIRLEGYNLGVNGEDLDVFVFKPFDKVNAQGTDLNVVDGEMMISFKNMKTNYNRQIKDNKFFINEIRNDYDNNNVFMLVPGGQKGNYFEDARFRLTVGDAVVKNPLKGYENVNIPKTRLAMWKKAMNNEIIS